MSERLLRDPAHADPEASCQSRRISSGLRSSIRPPAARKMPSTTASLSPGTRAVISCRVQSPASGIGVMLLSGSANTDRSVIGPVMERPSLTRRNSPARPGVSVWTRNSPRNTTVEPRKSSAKTSWPRNANPAGSGTAERTTAVPFSTAQV